MLETVAQKYRRIRAERAAAQDLHDFTSPTGMTWKLRKPDLAQFITSGLIPMSLAAKIAANREADKKPESAFAGMTWAERVKTIEFSAKVVRFCAVEPRIVENPIEPDEIGYDEVDTADFNAILEWAMPGGAEAEDLANFRSE